MQDPRTKSYEENLYAKIASSDRFGRRKVYNLSWTLSYMENTLQNNQVVTCNVTVRQMHQTPQAFSDSSVVYFSRKNKSFEGNGSQQIHVFVRKRSERQTEETHMHKLAIRFG